MAKKYKGFKGSGYNQAKDKMTKNQSVKLSHLMARIALCKMGIDSKY